MTVVATALLNKTSLQKVSFLSYFGIFENRIQNAGMRRDHKYHLFQNLLIKTRQQQHLTQQEVALRLGKPQSFVSKYESGERRLDVIEFIAVCNGLDINPTDIIEEINSNDR